MICPEVGCNFPINRDAIAGVTKYSKTTEGMVAWRKYETFTTDSLIDSLVRKGCCLRCPEEHCNNVVDITNINKVETFQLHCVGGCNNYYCFNCKLTPEYKILYIY
jgi:hypothetical protein